MFPTQIWSKLYVMTTEAWIRVFSWLIFDSYQWKYQAGEVVCGWILQEGLKFVIATQSGST